jgi:Uma2 family endonuclease
MSERATKQMTVDEFLVWAEGREGKWELHDGRPVAMAPERAVHARVKTHAGAALLLALRRAGAECGVYTDGLSVRVKRRRVFVPDLVVICPPAPEEDLETSTPLVVVEVLSPSTASYDHGLKLEGYFSLSSLAHCLLLDTDRRVVIQHSRGREGVIETRMLHEGPVLLDPPGIVLEVDEFFGGAKRVPPD